MNAKANKMLNTTWTRALLWKATMLTKQKKNVCKKININ